MFVVVGPGRPHESKAHHILQQPPGWGDSGERDQADSLDLARSRN
jgi:hypothetical protein